MHIHNSINENSSFIALPQRLITALGRLHNPVMHSACRRLQTSGSRVYIYDLVDQFTLCDSCSLATMLGYGTPASDNPELGGLAQLIHPEDLHRVADHYQRFTTLQPTEIIHISYRMRHADGSWRWLRSQETPLVSAIDGFPLQILGIVSLVADATSASPRRRRLLRHMAGRSRCRSHASTPPRSLFIHSSAKPPASPPSRPTFF